MCADQTQADNFGKSEICDQPAGWTRYRVLHALSEDCWCANWLVDWEYVSFAAITFDRAEFPRLEKFEAQEVAALKWLYQQAGAWVVWCNRPGEIQFIPAPEWERRFAVWWSENRDRMRQPPVKSGEESAMK
jgi:hypothetical protein